MYSSILPLAAIFSLAKAHGVILAAQGDAGSPPSVGFQGKPFQNNTNGRVSYLTIGQ